MPGGFRRLAERVDRLLMNRLGDRATLDDGSDISGAFASPFLDLQLGTKAAGYRLAASIKPDAVREPTFTMRAADAIGIRRDSFLTVSLPVAEGGGRYKVYRLEPDGSGMVDLILGVDNERTDDIT